MAKVMPSAKNLERALWLCAFVLLGAGYYLITVHYEQKISATADRVQLYRTKTVENEKLVGQTGRIRLLRRQIRSSLGDVASDRTTSQDVALLLGDIDRLAQVHQTQILAIAPQMKKDDSHRKRGFARANDALDISLRGRFADLLAFVSNLPRRHVLLRVAQMQFALSGSRNRQAFVPILDAKVHVLLYHIGKSDLLGDF